jgi:hypothetical protein
MRIFFLGLYLGIYASFALGQTPKLPLPSAFVMHPPPNQAAIQNTGSLQFEAFRNNLMLPYLQLSPKNSAIPSENSIADQNAQQLLIDEKSTKPSLRPKSFESSIQGFQFIQREPYSGHLNQSKQ